MEISMTSTYIWICIFLVASVMFWGTAFWAIVRGFIDIMDIVKTEKGKTVSPKAKPKDRV